MSDDNAMIRINGWMSDTVVSYTRFTISVKANRSPGDLPCAVFIGSGQVFTADDVYRILANFALSVDTGTLCGGHGTTSAIAEEIKRGGFVELSVEERDQ